MIDVSFIKKASQNIVPKNIVVLVGGWSVEREVSLSSGVGVTKALQELGHLVRVVDVTRDIKALVEALTPAPDVVCTTALHGHWVEDGCIQGLLEMMNIPYTHSGVLASSLTMHKPMTRNICQAAGILCAEGEVISVETYRTQKSSIPLPHVVKPLCEGSSVGIHVVFEGSACRLSSDSWNFGNEVLVERYIPGREIQVAVVGVAPLEPLKFVPMTDFMIMKLNIRMEKQPI